MALSGQQKALAKRIMRFRDRMMQRQEKRPDKNLEKYSLKFSSGLRTLRGVADNLVKYDSPLFRDVLNILQALQGDMDGHSTSGGNNNRP